MTIQSWVWTALAEVPKKRLILRCCLIHLKKNSICQRAVELGDREGRQREVVGEHDHVLARLGVPRSHTPELARVRLGRLGDGEPDRLVADESGRAVDGPGVESAALEVRERVHLDGALGPTEARYGKSERQRSIVVESSA